MIDHICYTVYDPWASSKSPVDSCMKIGVCATTPVELLGKMQQTSIFVKELSTRNGFGPFSALLLLASENALLLIRRPMRHLRPKVRIFVPTSLRRSRGFDAAAPRQRCHGDAAAVPWRSCGVAAAIGAAMLRRSHNNLDRGKDNQ